MISRTLSRLTLEAILPAIAVVVAKYVAVLFLTQWYNLQWHFDSQSLFPRLIFEDHEMTTFVNSYSNLFLYLVTLIGFGWVLAKAYHFHETHVAPQFVLKLLSWNMTKLLTTSEEIYHRGAVWISYLWLVTLLIVGHLILEITYWWVAVFAVACSSVVTWFFVADIEREIPKKK